MTASKVLEGCVQKTLKFVAVYLGVSYKNINADKSLDDMDIASDDLLYLSQDLNYLVMQYDKLGRVFKKDLKKGEITVKAICELTLLQSSLVESIEEAALIKLIAEAQQGKS